LQSSTEEVAREEKTAQAMDMSDNSDCDCEVIYNSLNTEQCV